MTTSEVAERLWETLDVQVFNEGTRNEERRVLFDVLEGADYEALSELIHGLEAGVDFAFSEVYDALAAIAQYDDLNTLEDELFSYCEPDIYSHDLLMWLANNLQHIAWVDAAIEEGIAGDTVMTMIAAGQAMAKEYVWRAVILLVQELAEEEA